MKSTFSNNKKKRSLNLQKLEQINSREAKLNEENTENNCQ